MLTATAKQAQKRGRTGQPGDIQTENEFRCLARFAPLDDYVDELASRGSGGRPESKIEKEGTGGKSEWYRCAEEIIDRERTRKKPIEDATFDDLLDYWMKQGT